MRNNSKGYHNKMLEVIEPEFDDEIEVVDLDDLENPEDDFTDDFDDPEDYWSPDQIDDEIDWERDSLMEKWIWVDDDEDEEDDEEEDHYDLVGVDGNIFAVIGTVSRWMREVGCDHNEIDRFRHEVMQQKNYDSALAMCIKYTDMCNQLYREQNR
jgi:hypothetical protein